MNQPNMTKDPIAVVDAAHTALQEAIKEHGARLAAERITAKNLELRTTRGMESIHLAVGLASWRIGGLVCAAPVLLRDDEAGPTLGRVPARARRVVAHVPVRHPSPGAGALPRPAS